MGTIHGSIIGALVLGSLPRLVENISRDYDLPGVSGDQGGIGGMLSISSLNHIIYGTLIAAFLLLEPRGIAGIWMRVKTYFKTWPFSY